MGTKKDYTEQLDLLGSMSSTDDTISLDLSAGSVADNSWLAQHSMSASTVDTLTLGSMSISGGSPVYTIGPTTGGIGPLISSGSTNWNWSNIATTVQSSTVEINSNQGSGVIEVKGENADIKINEVSLCETLKAIQDRLNILKPNPELEAEWDQLRELGQQYRKLEAEFAEKTKMWNTLKSMPPPEIE
jgi:hypothetical protein